MNPGHLLQLHLVLAKVNGTRPDLGILLKRSQSLVDLLDPVLLLYLHLQRLHRKRTQRTTQIDLALSSAHDEEDDHLAQHMTLVHRLTKDPRGPSGISERLWQDCDQPPGLRSVRNFDNCM